MDFEAWENELFDRYNREASQTFEEWLADVYDDLDE